jgi:hypothetical protein
VLMPWDYIADLSSMARNLHQEKLRAPF